MKLAASTYPAFRSPATQAALGSAKAENPALAAAPKVIGADSLGPEMKQTLETWEQQLDRGQIVNVDFADGRRVILKGDQAQASGFMNFVNTAIKEIQMGMASAPCASMIAGGDILKPALTFGASPTVAAYVDAIYPTAMHGVCVALSGAQFMHHWHKIKTKREVDEPLTKADYLNMATTALHVATSLAGVVGSVASLLNPELKSWATVGNAIALTGDGLNWAANRISYFDKRRKSDSAVISA